jgi:hypothetical protein
VGRGLVGVVVRERFGRERGAEESEGAGVLLFDGADGDAEAIGDFAMGKEFDFTEEKDGAAALGEFGDGLFEEREFLAGHDLLGDGRGGGGGGLVRGIGRSGRAFGRNAAALEAIDGEAAGGDVEECLGFVGGLVFDGRIDAQVGVVSDVLRFGGVAEKAGEVAAQWGNRSAVERRKVLGAGGFVRHGLQESGLGVSG